MHRVEFVFGSYKIIKSNGGFRRRINSQLTKLLFPGPAFIWSLFALFQTSKMAPSCVLAIYFSPSSFRQKEENMQVVLLLISGQLGVPSPSPKTEDLLLKRCPHIKQVYLVVEKQEQHLTPSRPPFCFSALLQNSRVFLGYVFSREKIIMYTLDSANEVHGVEINLSNCSWIFNFVSRMLFKPA